MLQLAAFLCSFPAVHKEAFGFFHFVCLQPEIRDLVILWLKKRNCLQIALIDWPVCVSMKQISKWSVLSVCDDRTATDRTSNNLSGLVDYCYIRADFQTQPPFFWSTKWFCFWKCFFLLLLFLILHYFRNNFFFFFFLHWSKPFFLPSLFSAWVGHVPKLQSGIFCILRFRCLHIHYI